MAFSTSSCLFFFLLTLVLFSTQISARNSYSFGKFQREDPKEQNPNNLVPIETNELLRCDRSGQGTTMASSATAPNSLSFFSSSLFLSSSHQIPKTYISVSKLGSGRVSKPLSVSSQLATLPILSFEGEKVGETYLDLKAAPEDTARAVVHRAIVTDLNNKRRGTASTLTRGEVRGGGIKPYSQKKTGHARRGSQRTPLRPGGGVVFGPRPKDWSIKINRKEKKLAISTALSSAASAEGGAIVVEEFGEKFEKPKTKDFLAAMQRWGLDPKEKAMFLMIDVDENVAKSSRNIGTLRMLTPRTLNLFDILNADKLVLTPAAVEFLNARYGVDAVEEEDDDEDETEGSEEA